MQRQAGHEATTATALGFAGDRSVACGISLGIPGEAAIDGVGYAREPLSSFCTFDGLAER